MSGILVEEVNGVELVCLDSYILVLCPDYVSVFPTADIEDIKKEHKRNVQKVLGDKLKIIHIECQVVEDIERDNVRRLLTRYYFVRR